MELVVLRMLSSDSALSLDEALLRLRVLAAGPASPVVASVKSLHKGMGGKRCMHNQSPKHHPWAASAGSISSARLAMHNLCNKEVHFGAAACAACPPAWVFTVFITDMLMTQT